MYAAVGRPSIAPERLLKSTLLIALFSVRSDRLFCEMLDYNILFPLVPGHGSGGALVRSLEFFEEPCALDRHDIVKLFFAGAVKQARRQGLLYDEHFTVDGTLIQAWASFKSLKRKDGTPPKSGSDGTGMVDFRSEKRSNATHQSATDPEAKADAQSVLVNPPSSASGPMRLMENRSGLLVDVRISDSTLFEPRAAAPMLDRRRPGRRGLRTLGADKGYCTKEFVAWPRGRSIAPHIARIESRSTGGRDGRTTRHGLCHQPEKAKAHRGDRLDEVGGWLAAQSLRRNRQDAARGAPRTTCCAWHDCRSPRDRCLRNPRIDRKSSMTAHQRHKYLSPQASWGSMNALKRCFTTHSSTAC